MSQHIATNPLAVSYWNNCKYLIWKGKIREARVPVKPEVAGSSPVAPAR
jgi:hypothetical protein